MPWENHCKTKAINTSNVLGWRARPCAHHPPFNEIITRSYYPNDLSCPSVTFTNSHHLLLVPESWDIITGELSRNAACTLLATFWRSLDKGDLNGYRKGCYDEEKVSKRNQTKEKNEMNKPR